MLVNVINNSEMKTMVLLLWISLLLHGEFSRREQNLSRSKYTYGVYLFDKYGIGTLNFRFEVMNYVRESCLRNPQIFSLSHIVFFLLLCSSSTHNYLFSLAISP